MKRSYWVSVITIGLFIGSCTIIFCSGCKDSKKAKNDTPPSLFPQPVIVALNTDTGYRIHPVTGDSIKPVINSLGDTVKTGIPVVVTGKIIDPSGLEKPKMIPVSWITKGTPATNIHVVPDKLTVKSVDESKLERFVLGKDTSSFVLLDDNGDTIPTGVPIPVTGKIVPCKLPQPVDALPMSRNNTTMYRMQSLGAYHGLKSFVHAIMADRRGKLWISSVGGFSCYDGKSFLHFTGKEGMIGTTSAFDILEDRNGNIWLSYGVEGISCYDGRNFLNFPGYNKKRGYSGGTNAMMADREGNLWFTSLVNGLTRYDGKSFTHFTAKEGLTSDLTGALLEDSKGNIWIGTNGKGVCRFDGRSFTYFTSKDGLSNDYVNCILEDRKGNLWLGTQEGLNRYDHKSFTWFTENEGLGKSQVIALHEDKTGDLWIATPGKGIARYNGKEFIQISESEGLLGNIVMEIVPGNDGDLWFATDRGISYYDGRFVYYQGMAGLPLYKPMAMKTDHNGNLLLGIPYVGLFKYDGRSIARLNEKDSSRSDYIIRDILEDSKGNIWIAPFKDGLLRYDGKQLTNFTRKSGLISDTVFSLLQDNKGNIWMGTRGGLTRYDGNVFVHFTEKEGLPDKIVRNIFEDSKSNIWISTRKGVTRYDGKSFTHYTEKEGFSGNYMPSMLEDKAGNILFGSSEKGIIRFDGRNFTFISQREGLASKFITTMHNDDQGNVWVTAQGGLSKIPAGYASNPKISTGEQPGIINYGLKDALLSDYIIRACPDHHNRLWFVENDMAASLTTFDMNNPGDIKKPPAVSLEDISINDKFIDFRNPDSTLSNKVRFTDVPSFYNYPNDLKLPWNLNQLTFHFIASGSLTEENIFYSYKLDGLGNEWSTPSTENKARYQYLPPGNYTFKVRAMNRSQVWGEPYEYKFTIIPPFWQRWWFWALIGLFIIGIVLWLVQKRINTIRKRENEKTESVKKIAELELQSQQAILNERLRISSELHDEVGATLSGIAMYSHLTKEQMKKGQTTEIEKSLNVMQQSSAQMVDKLNDIVWLINPEQDSLQKLIERLEEYATDMAAIKSMKVKIAVPDKIAEINLPVDSRRNIYLFCKEAINNSVKYSNGSLLELTVMKVDNKLEFSVSDNGKGFDAVMVRRGNGLENMQKRADEIGAKLTLQSKLNEGAMVSMQCEIGR